MSDLMERSAVIDGPYRYEARRVWDANKPLLVVCMLNPSTADHLRDDPTVLTLIHFAKLWGYGGLVIVNLFAFRTSKPAELANAADPFGPENGRHLVAAINIAVEAGRLLVAWGNGGDMRGYDRHFVHRARLRGLELICLGTTAAGHPKHPLARGYHRIPRDQQPIEWRG